MIGLSRMCWFLAWKRAFNSDHRSTIDPLPRELCQDGTGSASEEYYRICDRIARGEAP